MTSKDVYSGQGVLIRNARGHDIHSAMTEVIERKTVPPYNANSHEISSFTQDLCKISLKNHANFLDKSTSLIFFSSIKDRI